MNTRNGILRNQYLRTKKEKTMSIMDDIFDIENSIRGKKDLERSFDNILSWAIEMEQMIEKMKGKYCPCCGQKVKKEE